MKSARTGTVAVVTALAFLTGCDSAGSETAAPADGPTTPAASATATTAAAPSVPEELRGNWMARLTQADIRHDLKVAGFRKWADAYIVGEEAQMGVLYVLTLDEGTFNLAYFEANKVWHVGWKGIATEEGVVLTLLDDFSGITESYRWSADDDRLTLDFHSADGDLLDGIPLEVFSRAHFSRPLTAVDCGPADLLPVDSTADWQALAHDIQEQLTTCG